MVNDELMTKLYNAIVSAIDAGQAPSLRELGRRVGIRSTSTVHKYLLALEEQGMIQRTPGEKRNITVPGRRARMVPVIGTAAAGTPILAQEEYIGFIPYGGREKGDLFAIKVRGDSMIKAGILDGDTVVIRPVPTAEDGQIILALLEDEATIKRFYREDGRFRLQPENDAMEPIYTDSLRVLGRVVACIRQYEEE